MALLITQFLLIVGGSVLATLVGMALVRRAVPLSALREHHDVAGYIISVIGVAYAVLLVFVVIIVWERLEGARATTEREASSLSNLFRAAQGLSDPARQRVGQLAEEYARSVVREEWPLLAQGQPSPHAWKLVDALWQAVREVEPRTAREQILYDQVMTHLGSMNEHRKMRLLASHEAVPSLLWAVLWGGAIITVGFTYFFGVKNSRAQALMVASLAATLALNLFVIAAIDFPFRGVVRVKPEAFLLALERFEEISAQPAAQ
jgi:hypothetical protein